MRYCPHKCFSVLYTDRLHRQWLRDCRDHQLELGRRTGSDESLTCLTNALNQRHQIHAIVASRSMRLRGSILGKWIRVMGHVVEIDIIGDLSFPLPREGMTPLCPFSPIEPHCQPSLHSHDYGATVSRQRSASLCLGREAIDCNLPLHRFGSIPIRIRFCRHCRVPVYAGISGRLWLCRCKSLSLCLQMEWMLNGLF